MEQLLLISLLWRALLIQEWPGGVFLLGGLKE
jgi:hypothetical protein